MTGLWGIVKHNRGGGDTMRRRPATILRIEDTPDGYGRQHFWLEWTVSASNNPEQAPNADGRYPRVQYFHADVAWYLSDYKQRGIPLIIIDETTKA